MWTNYHTLTLHSHYLTHSLYLIHTLSHTLSHTLVPHPIGAQHMAPTDRAGGGLSLPPCKGIIKTMSRHGNDYIIAVLSGLLPSHPAGATPPRARPQRAATRHAAPHTGGQKKTSLGGAGHQGKCFISWRRPTLPQANSLSTPYTDPPHTLSHTLAPQHSLPLTHSLIHSHILSRSHTRSPTLTLSHTLSLPHSCLSPLGHSAWLLRMEPAGDCRSRPASHHKNNEPPRE